MKSFFRRVMTGVALICSFAVNGQPALFISEILDPADDYNGRYIELYNPGAEVIDFSTTNFYLSRQSNGGTTWGEVALSGSILPGSTFLIGGSAFESIYGFAPDQVSGILTGNGDDPYSLYRNGDHTSGTLHDIFGERDVDGTGEPWEYTDSRALRLPGISSPNQNWNPAEWQIRPADIADGDPGLHEFIGEVPGPGSADYILSIENDTLDIEETINLPVMVSEIRAEDSIISFQFEILYDSLLLEYTGYSLLGGIAEGGSVAVNAEQNGILSLAYMNTNTIVGAGILITLQFNGLAIDSTRVSIVNGLLNTIPAQEMRSALLLIEENTPPRASVTYNDSLLRFADSLLIIANFNEPMDPSSQVLLGFTGAFDQAPREMFRLNDSIYNYELSVPKADGQVHVWLSGGRDLFGNRVDSLPNGGEYFSIIPFLAGDVDDDGQVLAYDAALALQHSVGIDPLPLIDPLPWDPWRDSTANVDGQGAITAYDAGLILQYSVGIPSFSLKTRAISPPADVELRIEDGSLVLYAIGDLLGLNVFIDDAQQTLGSPEILNKNCLYAFNLDRGHYLLGMCSSSFMENGKALVRIPVRETGPLEIEMLINSRTEHLVLDLDVSQSIRWTEKIHIYPNPASHKIFIEGTTGLRLVQLIHISGEIMREYKAVNTMRELDISGLQTGLYLLRLEMEERVCWRKLLIQ